MSSASKGGGEMFDPYDSARLSMAGADETPRVEAVPDLDVGTGLPERPCLAATYRQEAERWNRLADQMSLTTDREYCRRLAAELRSKAAALETSSRDEEL